MAELKIYFLFLVLVITGLVFRVDLVQQNADYWHDEAFQNLYSSKPTSFILSSTDVHPPLFNLIAKLVLYIDNSILGTRYFIVCCSILFLLSVFLVVKKHFSETTALYSVFLFSILSTWIYYSTEFRSYMFIFMLIPIQMHFLFMILEERPKPKHFIGCILLSTLLMYLHYFTALFIFSQFIYILTTKDRELLRKSILMYSAIAILSVPLVYYVWGSIQNIQSFWFGSIGLVSLISTLSYSFTLHSFVSVWLMLIMLSIIILFYQGKERYHKLLVFQYFIPIIIMFIISQFQPMYHHRYFLFGAIGLIILIADCVYIAVDDYHVNYNFAVLFLILVFGLSFISYNQMVKEMPNELRDSAVFLDNIIKTDPINNNYTIIHTSTFSQTPYKVYLHKNNKVRNLLCVNITEKQLFTMGGSVVNNDEILSVKDDCYNYTSNDSYVYYVSDRQIQEVVVWQKDGLIVSRKEIS